MCSTRKTEPQRARRCAFAVALASVMLACPTRGASARPDEPRPSPDARAPDGLPLSPGAAPEPAAAAAPPALAASPRIADRAEPPVSPDLDGRKVDIHGFVSEGGFLSTSNEYIGSSSRGSLKLAEAAISFSTQVNDRLRVGAQLFARDFGTFEDAPRFDWAFFDYRWRSWLGLRAGIIRMPFGLYNEYSDIDSARLPILLPQSVYPFRNRDILLSHRGFGIYGDRALGTAGELEYQAWLGTLDIPANALMVSGATLDAIDTRYVTGAQVFYQPPLDGLRIGATAVRTSVDFKLTLPPATTTALIMAGVVPPDYKGAIVVSQRPDTWIIGSAEYVHEAWSFAAEYSRTFKRQRTSLPAVIKTFDEDNERFYAMASYRQSAGLELGGYYSVYHLDANDRHGRDPRYAERYFAFQRDLAATVRIDVNDHWLWKLEAHFIDGTADLEIPSNPHPDRYWGLFLLRTTVTF
jgi:hypothetical protein